MSRGNSVGQGAGCVDGASWLWPLAVDPVAGAAAGVHDGKDLDRATRADSINQRVRENLEAAPPHPIVEDSIAIGRRCHALFGLLSVAEEAQFKTFRLSLIPSGRLDALFKCLLMVDDLHRIRSWFQIGR